MDTIGSRLRALRKSRELNQTQLSRAIGVDQSTISDIERGKGFSAQTLMALADFFGVTPTQIMRGGPAAALEELSGLVVKLAPDQVQTLIRVARALASAPKDPSPDVESPEMATFAAAR